MNAALGLVNSEWWRGRGDGPIDKLLDADWLAAYAAEAGLGELPPPTAGDLRVLRELRAVLRSQVEAPADADPAVLDGYASRAAVRRRVVDGEVVLVPVRRDWGWAISEIAASFVELLAHGERGRIKVCANDECQWSFYDESRNRNRRWCGAASCGTADKVRRFRERRRTAAG